jgi:hypothetical protein
LVVLFLHLAPFFVVPVQWLEAVEVFFVVEGDWVTVVLPSQQLLPTFIL